MVEHRFVAPNVQVQLLIVSLWMMLWVSDGPLHGLCDKFDSYIIHAGELVSMVTRLFCKQ